MSPKKKNWIVPLVLIALFFYMAVRIFSMNTAQPKVEYRTIIDYFKNEQVAEYELDFGTGELTMLLNDEKKTTITYAARPRVAGQSKYSIRKLVRFSINTILCFSDLPLKLGVYSGLFVGFLGLLLMIYTIWSRVRTGTPSGYATSLKNGSQRPAACGSVMEKPERT